MDTIKIKEKKSTNIIAHRGLSGIEQENTTNAFVAACNRSYFGVEWDIHVTADNRYLVYHDDSTGRLCDKDLVMERSDFMTLRALRIRESGGGRFDEWLHMPTLEEALAVLARYEKTGVIELKNAMRPENIREIVSICRECYDLEKIIFISFIFENLVELRKLLPESRMQFLTCELTEELPRKLREYRFDIDVDCGLLNEENIKFLHENGIAINCWTCDDPGQAGQLIRWGVDFITTNILE